MSYTLMALLLAGTGKAIYDANSDYFKNRKRIKEFKDKWETIMQQNKSKFDGDEALSYEAVDVIPKGYGVDAIITIPVNKDFKELQKMTQKLEIAYGADIIMNLTDNKTSVYLKCHFKDCSISEEDKIIFKWYKLWYNIMLNDAFKNEDTEPFHIKDVIGREYGIMLKLTIPRGKSITNLDSAKSVIEADFKAKLFYEWSRYTGDIIMHIITKEIDKNDEYVPVKVANNKFYLGMTHYREKMIVDIDDSPMLLVSGSPGSGKSRLIHLVVTNLSYNSDDIEHIFLMASAKPDFEPFKYLKHTIIYTDSYKLEERLKLSDRALKYVSNENERRNILFKESGCANINTYNKKHKKNPLKRLFIWIDEASEYMPPKNSNGTIKSANGGMSQMDAMKVGMYENIMRIAKECRSSGIYLCMATQRPDIQDMVANLKMAFNIRVAFAQNNKNSSLVVCDNDDATKLDKREALLMYGNERLTIKTPYIDDSLIKKLLVNKIDFNHKYLNLNEWGEVVTNSVVDTYVNSESVIVKTEVEPITEPEPEVEAKNEPIRFTNDSSKKVPTTDDGKKKPKNNRWQNYLEKKNKK